jgi:type IV secretion system protein VirB4
MLDMIFKSKKKAGDVKLEVPVPDFIPYACHYDADTILTRNGELLQVIKVTGFSNEAIGSEQMDLRDMLRQAVLKNITNDNFALWLHTVRRKNNLDPGGDFPAGFSYNLNKNWKERHKWHETYVNEVYITIIRDSAKASMTNPSEMLRSMYFSALRKKHEAFLAEAHQELEAVVIGMLDTLSPFGAKRLTVTHERGVYYSDQLQFFAKILNLAELPVPMPINDLSEYLASHSIAIGFDTMEVRGRAGKHFGVLFTLKEYQELPTAALDRFLQLPQEFIITQTLDFIDCKRALKEFKKQKYILSVGRDDALAEAIGLDFIIESDNGSATAFGDSQISIFLINSDLRGLAKNVNDATDRLSSLGLVSTRSDLRMEECFWAQLPGNFSFLSRRRPISTSLVGGFASLYNFPAGKRAGNLWGPAVTMFNTAEGTPYFFSFHEGDNGHTAIIGPAGMGKTVLMNFMVSEARKFNGRLFVIDQMRASKVFLTALGGKYTIIKPNEVSSSYAFNPFNMPDSAENRAFLYRWMGLLASADGGQISNAERDHLAKLVDYVYTLPREQRRLGVLAGSFGPVEAGSFGEKMALWYGTGKYAHLFDNDIADAVPFDAMIYGFGVSWVISDGLSLGPVVSYLMHRFEMLLDGIPTIIVIEEAWNLVNNPIFAPELADWLERLKAKNALVIFATETIPNDGKDVMTNTVTNAIATQIFLPNPDADESSRAYKDIWGLSNEEFNTLSMMRVEKRQFMLRQGGQSVVAALDLSGLKELEILSGSDKTVIVMESAISEKGDNPEDWLPLFYEKTNNQR